MIRDILVLALLTAGTLCGCASEASKGTLSKQEVEALWETLLQNEEYRAIEYDEQEYAVPTDISMEDESKLVVREGREAYLKGFFGMSGGGGWAVEGRLEAELLLPEGILQLYSKAAKRWLPGLVFIEARYDVEKYPEWEFRLILREKEDRKKITTLWSTEFGPDKVIRPNPVGQRHPRGELQYDDAKRMVNVKIVGLYDPITTKVQIP